MKTVLMASSLALMIAPAVFADEATFIDVNSVASSGDSYVNIGEYTGGTTGTLTTIPITTGVVMQSPQLPVVGVTAPLVTESAPYLPPIGADSVFPAAGTGSIDDDYANDRLAAYDTNRDGVVTSSEAIANLAPLTAPTVNAVMTLGGTALGN